MKTLIIKALDHIQDYDESTETIDGSKLMIVDPTSTDFAAFVDQQAVNGYKARSIQFPASISNLKTTNAPIFVNKGGDPYLDFVGAKMLSSPLTLTEKIAIAPVTLIVKFRIPDLTVNKGTSNRLLSVGPTVYSACRIYMPSSNNCVISSGSSLQQGFSFTVIENTWISLVAHFNGSQLTVVKDGVLHLAEVDPVTLGISSVSLGNNGESIADSAAHIKYAQVIVGAKTDADLLDLYSMVAAK